MERESCCLFVFHSSLDEVELEKELFFKKSEKNWVLGQVRRRQGCTRDFIRPHQITTKRVVKATKKRVDKAATKRVDKAATKRVDKAATKRVDKAAGHPKNCQGRHEVQRQGRHEVRR